MLNANHEGVMQSRIAMIDEDAKCNDSKRCDSRREKDAEAIDDTVLLYMAFFIY
jgi:hypothetical protein